MPLNKIWDKVDKRGRKKVRGDYYDTFLPVIIYSTLDK